MDQQVVEEAAAETEVAQLEKENLERVETVKDIIMEEEEEEEQQDQTTY